MHKLLEIVKCPSDMHLEVFIRFNDGYIENSICYDRYQTPTTYQTCNSKNFPFILKMVIKFTNRIFAPIYVNQTVKSTVKTFVQFLSHKPALQTSSSSATHHATITLPHTNPRRAARFRYRVGGNNFST